MPAQWNVGCGTTAVLSGKDILPCLDDAGEKKVGKPFSMQSFYFPAIPDSTAVQKKWCRHCRAGRTRRCPSVLGFPRFLIWLRAVVTAGRMLKSSACMGQTRWGVEIKTAGMREKVFVITSGVSDVREIGKRLIECGLKRDGCDGRICAVLSGGTDKNIVPGRSVGAAYRRGTLYLSDPESGDFRRKKNSIQNS